MRTILLVDDERNILNTLSAAVEREGYRVLCAESSEEALRVATVNVVDVVMLDILLPGMDGLQALDRFHREFPRIVVIMMSGHGSIETAVTATKRGAYDFIEKPISLDKIFLTLRNACEHIRLEEELSEWKEASADRYRTVGESRCMRDVSDQIRKVAPTQARVLITGENGTGKELVARAIHEQSERRGGPFVRVNCAAIPGTLIESEMFGYEKGAFTGAGERRAGKFERANGGTIFLDEIGDMNLDTQAKVLRVLQEGEFERVGGDASITVDVRVIAATNKDLTKAIEAGEFREDLFYRLSVVPIRVPPLRERGTDVVLLAEHFLKESALEHTRPARRFAPEAFTVLSQHSWPGNVRELRNTIERLVIMTDDETIDGETVASVLADLPGFVRPAPAATGGGALRTRVAEHERSVILAELDRAAGSVAKAAEALSLERSHLYKKMRALGIPIGRRT